MVQGEEAVRIQSSQWQQTGKPSGPLQVKFICEIFESGLGSSRPMQLGHKEGVKVGGVHFLYSRKLPYCYFKEKKVYPRKPLAAHVREPHTLTYTQPVSHVETHITRSLRASKWNSSKIYNINFSAGRKKGSHWWIMFPGMTELTRCFLLWVWKSEWAWRGYE